MKILRCLFVGISILFLLSGCGKKVPKMFPPDKALEIASRTQEAQAVMNYQNGALADCLEKKVVKSCDSEWLTCRDNAWVVQYLLTPQCPVKGDGRLGMNFVIDGISGEIISHYPEVEYFSNERFCRDDGDCIAGQKECLNFIAAPFAHLDKTSPFCRCQDSRCILKE